MIVLLLQATLNTITVQGRRFDYLFRRPENAPVFLKQDVASKEEDFSVFILSKPIIQNINIVINIISGPAKNFALVSDSALGVTLEYIRFKIDCKDGYNHTFTPIQKSPQLGMFWCVF